jgi:hypothetical protein
MTRRTAGKEFEGEKLAERIEQRNAVRLEAALKEHLHLGILLCCQAGPICFER